MQKNVVIRFKIDYDPDKETEEDVLQYCRYLISNAAALAPEEEFAGAAIDGHLLKASEI